MQTPLELEEEKFLFQEIHALDEDDLVQQLEELRGIYEKADFPEFVKEVNIRMGTFVY